MTVPTFRVLEVVVRPEQVEKASARLLAAGAVGIEERDDTTLARGPAGRSKLVASFPTHAAAGAAHRRLGGRLRTLRGDDWADAWKKFARARRFGRLVVAPRDRKLRSRRGDRIVRIDPGRAFGTGSHATTALCLSFLAGNVVHGVRVLDVGTGSGVLAIAAAKLGARAVVGVDVDPEAVATARENVAANAVNVRVVRGDVRAVRGRFDLVVANLTAGDLAAAGADLRATLARGGRLFATGILSGQLREVRDAMRPLHGIAIRRGEWRALELER